MYHMAMGERREPHTSVVCGKPFVHMHVCTYVYISGGEKVRANRVKLTIHHFSLPENEQIIADNACVLTI